MDWLAETAERINALPIGTVLDVGRQLPRLSQRIAYTGVDTIYGIVDRFDCVVSLGDRIEPALFDRLMGLTERFLVVSVPTEAASARAIRKFFNCKARQHGCLQRVHEVTYEVTGDSLLAKAVRLVPARCRVSKLVGMFLKPVGDTVELRRNRGQHF